MEYRHFPKIAFKPSALGFGAMRLPVIDNDQSRVDVPEATRMIRYAIDRGVNYLDTAYFYHGGYAEQAVGAALRDGYREKIQLATKFPAREVKRRADFDDAFARQLDRLRTDKVDFYLLHGLHRPVWDELHEMGILDWLEHQIGAGKVGHAGFSFHDEYDYFTGIVDAWDNWTFTQLHFNYMDVDYQAGQRGLEYAAERGLGIIIMEPLRGGQLARLPQPEAVAQVWAQAPVRRSPVEWAFRFIWDYPQVSLLLSGMSTMEQVVQNVDIASRAGNSRLTDDDRAVIEQARQAYRGLRPVPCTGCRYCMPCPSGVAIPDIFRLYNEVSMYGMSWVSRLRYNGGFFGIKPEQNAANCTECEQCVAACPQHIRVPDWLKKVHEELAD
jgi:predicted aldo/keto reductase-like oxidoreductase